MTANQINYWRLQEDKRHNVTSENETGRHNQATEKETGRHNLAVEGETNRHNLQTEQVDIGKLNESVRHNYQTEALGRDQLSETIRHNQTTENETKRHNVADETIRGQSLSIDAAQLLEQSRHNVETEHLQTQSTEAQAYLNTARAELARIQSSWENILNSQKYDVNAATKREIEARIDKLVAETSVIPQGNAQKWINAVGSSLGDVARIISQFK